MREGEERGEQRERGRKRERERNDDVLIGILWER